MSTTLIWNTKVSTRNNCEFLVFRVIKQRRMIRCVTWTRFRVYYRTIYRYRSISTPIMFTSSIGTINLGIEEEKGGKSSLLKGTTISQSYGKRKPFYYDKPHSVWKSPKKSHLNFVIFHQFCRSFPKLTIFGVFNELLSTQNVDVARFARNDECDFFVICQTPCSPLKDFVVFGYSNPRNCFFVRGIYASKNLYDR